MAMSENVSSDIMRICIQRGFFYPSADIYSGPSGFYDWGPLGNLLKNKIENIWRKMFIFDEDTIYEIDGALILPYDVLKASGHVDEFTDPKVECKKCGKVYRADKLIEERLQLQVEGKSPGELTEILQENNLMCPNCTSELSDVKLSHLMFPIWIGLGQQPAFLRPETAQSIFLNFKHVKNSMRCSLPFGIAQLGKSFRNEISPRRGLIRMREFYQMEIEMFVDPRKLKCHPRYDEIKDLKIRLFTQEAQTGGLEETLEVSAEESLAIGGVPNQYMAYYLAKEMLFYAMIGIPFEKMRFRHLLPEETPHYSKGNFDLEIDLDAGKVEVVGNAYRTDYDLSRHMTHSKKNLSVFLEGERIIPHVIEPSFGLDRSIYCVLELTFRIDERGWTWFEFPNCIAPIEVCIFPLVKKEKIQLEKAKKIFHVLKSLNFDVLYDERGHIGRRYARADEIGVPYCATVDYDTSTDNSITIRDRNTMKQIRVDLDILPTILEELLTGKKSFEGITKNSGVE